MDQQNIIDCYNRTAADYAAHYLNELNKKHFDRILLHSFLRENASAKILDLGCGPGQTTRFLSECGAKDITGVDISVEMIKLAKELHSSVNFETGDMLNLHYADQSIDAVIAFFAIVHFDETTLPTVFSEVRRVLKNNGQFLFSFHAGQQVVHLDQLIGHDVNIDFHFFEAKKVTDLLIKTGFSVIDSIERQPYPEVEYPSNRAYIWSYKNPHGI